MVSTERDVHCVYTSLGALCICGNIWHKVCQILHESQESLDFMLTTGLSPVPYLLHLIGVGMYTSVRDYMTQEVHPLVKNRFYSKNMFGVVFELGGFEESLSKLGTWKMM